MGGKILVYAHITIVLSEFEVHRRRRAALSVILYISRHTQILYAIFTKIYYIDVCAHDAHVVAVATAAATHLYKKAQSE